MNTLEPIYEFPKIKALCDPDGSLYTNPDKLFFKDYNHNEGHNYKLSKHPSNRAVKIMTKDPHIINVAGLVRNTNSNILQLLELSKHRFDRPDWEKMASSHNPTILEFLGKYKKHINWKILSENDSEKALDILEENFAQINWEHFALNVNPRAIILLEQNMQRIQLWMLSSNPKAMDLIYQNIEGGWSQLGSGLSRNPNAMDILIRNPNLIIFDSILTNPGAISYIEEKIEEFKKAGTLNSDMLRQLAQNPNSLPLFEKIIDDKFVEEYGDVINEIQYYHFNLNLSGYALNYKAMSRVRNIILERNLTGIFFHPDIYKEQMNLHLENGGDETNFNLEIRLCPKIWDVLSDVKKEKRFV